GPPPRMISEGGRCSTLTASRFVQYSTSPRPGIGGIAGEVPVAITTALVASYVVPLTETFPGPASLPAPRTKRPPFFSKRSTSPPTPMPRTTASTCSAISPGVAGRGPSSRRHSLLQRLIESQGLPLRPNFLGVLRAQSFAPGATLLLAQELPDAGSGRPLMHPGRARQPRRRPWIPVGSNNLREIVKLQDH